MAKRRAPACVARIQKNKNLVLEVAQDMSEGTGASPIKIYWFLKDRLKLPRPLDLKCSGAIRRVMRAGGWR